MLALQCAAPVPRLTSTWCPWFGCHRSASSHGMDEKALGAIERWAEQLGKIRKQIGKQH